MISLQDKTVLITGGTCGLGKAMGLAFARFGAAVFLTHRWGSADEDALADEFRREGATTPYILESDVSDTEAMEELITNIKKETGQLDIVISNVAFSKVVNDMQDLSKKSLDISLSYSAWPLVELAQTTHAVIGRFPRYLLAISSDGANICHSGYELAGASKAVLETLCRYLALRLKEHGVRVNAIRPGFMDTASSRATFGSATIDAAQKQCDGLFLNPNDVAQVAVALCSGLMDAVTGQVIVVDEGWSLVSPVAFLTSHGLPKGFSGVPGGTS